MEGFKKLPKMQSFKTGGFVTKQEFKREEKAEEVKDTAEDKKIVKKAFSIHDKELHEGEKTDLSSLKKGGRAKKEAGTVKKYKAGGSISGEASLSGDASSLLKVKPATKKAAAPSKAVAKPAAAGIDKPLALKCGGGVKKMAAGMSTGTPAADPILQRAEAARNRRRAGNLATLTPAQRDEFAAQQAAAAAAAGAQSGGLGQAQRGFKSGKSVKK